MRRALVVAYEYPPIASAAAERSRQLARHLPAHGWRAVVIAPRAGVSWAYDADERLPVDVEVRRTRSLEPSRVLKTMRRERATGGSATESRALAGRRLREWVLVPDSRAGWIPFAVAGALRSAGDVEVVVTTSPPASAHVAGYAVACVTGLPWVADFQDPWSLPAFQAWAGRLRPWVDTRLERAVLQRADRVVTTTPWLAEQLAGRGAEDRVRLVPNGFDPADYSAARPSSKSSFTLAHTGSFYGPRSPEPLLSAVAAALAAEPGIRPALRLRLVGSEDAQNAARLDAAIRRLGLGDIVERPGQVPRRKALRVMTDAAVLLLVTDAADGGRGLVPLKLYEYLGAGRPVLALTPPDGEAGRLVRAAGGIAVDPSDTPAAAAALLRLYERWRAGDDSNASAIALDRYRWDRLAGTLAQVLSEVASKRCPAQLASRAEAKARDVKDRAVIGVEAEAFPGAGFAPFIHSTEGV